MIEPLTSHLANLTILLDYFGSGGAEKNRWIVAEFEECNQRLIAALKEKHSDATRKSDYRPFSGDEDRAALPSSLAGRSGSTRSEGGPSPSGGTTLRR